MVSFKERVELALEEIKNNILTLPPEVLAIQGMSGKLGRNFLNKICRYDDTRYLEIGSWYGSTVVAAAYQNPGTFKAIDNFSQFSGTEEILLQNIQNSNCKVEVINCDCWSFQPPMWGINTYFFDGPHGKEDHKKALSYYYPSLAEEFIFIVDDFNGQEARDGTYEVLQELNPQILFQTTVGETSYSDHNGWWNGFYIGVLHK